ncbi:SDR family oxidoreductase [Alloalcanivorax gelatiniphagus]
MVVDTVNPPESVGYRHAFHFLQTTTRNLLDAGQQAGVGHYVLLSIVGANRLDSEYFRGKATQEHLVRSFNLPHSIVQSTTFFEALTGPTSNLPVSSSVHVPLIEIQPVAADDLANVLTRVIWTEPRDSCVTLAGPERMPFSHFVESFFEANGDPRRVLVDEDAEYLGTRFKPCDDALLPDVRVGQTTLSTWLNSVPTPV